MRKANTNKGALVRSLVAAAVLPCLFGVATAADMDFPDVLPPPPELVGSGTSVQPVSSEPVAPPVDPLVMEPLPVVPAAIGSAAMPSVQPIADPLSVQTAPSAPAVESTSSAPAYVEPVYAAPVDPNAPRIVYTAPDPIDPVFLTIPEPTPAPVQASGTVSRGFVISPPSATMPAAYFELPLSDDAIPGIVLPELEDGYSYPDTPLAAPARRSTGLSVRQLEPLFALAKGSEGAALDAKRRSDDTVYRDQLAKARAAYMDIVSNADAGSEAREEAWYGVARCEYRLGNWWRSFEALERSFPEEFEPGEVAGRIKLEVFIGERLWGFGPAPAPGAVVEGRQFDGYRAAARVYKALMFNQPVNDDAPLALLRQGDAASYHGEWVEAAGYYRQLVEYYPESEQAMQGRSSLTEAIYRQDWPTGFPEAARQDVNFIMEDVERADARLSPEAADRRRRAVEVANDLDAETKLRHAKEYLKSVKLRKSRDGAVFLLKDIVTLYPNTRQSAEASDILLSLGETPPAGSQGYSPFAQVQNPIGDYTSPESEAWDDFPTGTVSLEVPSDIPQFAMPESPSRQTVYEALPDPVPVE